jgi:uncharacterized protein (DUF4415 family)
MSRESEVSRRPEIVMPSDAENTRIEREALGDPDAALLTPEELDAMVPLARLRGRPRSDRKKVLVSIRYSIEVLDYFRSTGDGWQSRMDAVLKDYVLKAVTTPARRDSPDETGQLKVA